MLIYKKASNILSKSNKFAKFNNNNLNFSLLCTNRNLYYFHQDPDSQIYDKFLNSKESKLRNYTEGQFKFSRVIVPRVPVQSQQIMKKLQQEWKNKKLVFNIDFSALVGHKRLFMKQHLEQNVYKGVSQPEALFSQLNPTVQMNHQQLKFDEENFLFSDPQAIQILKKNKDLSEQRLQQMIEDRLADLYQKQPQRFVNRLKKQYKVPQAYCKIIQLAVYQQNPIYFCGLNQYSFRSLLTRYLGLSQIKQLFLLSLKFSQSESFKYKLLKNQANKQRIQQRYHIYARQLIYLNHFKIIKKIENGEFIKRLSYIANNNELLNSDSQAQQRSTSRRRNLAKKMKSKHNMVILSHQYTAQTIQDYVVIKDFESNSPFTTIQQISPKSQNSLAPLQKIRVYHSPKETDAQKIQKNAILEVMLGDLWNEPYTLNRFPYLSENFKKLSEQDQKYVNDIYHEKLTKYTGAKRVFYAKNINKLDSMEVSESQLRNIRNQYDQKRRQYQKYKENMAKKLEQKQKILQKQKQQKKQMKKKQSLIYQESYEQVIVKDQKKVESVQSDKINQIKSKSNEKQIYVNKNGDIPQNEQKPSSSSSRKRRRRTAKAPETSQ